MNKAANTRLNILQKAFELIYTKGYQTTSIDEIIATTKVTKGAFYYHFKTKDDMGIALINEILNPAIVEGYSELLKNTKDPNTEIYGITKHLLFEDPALLVKYGCPVSNLAQEMTPWHKEFSSALGDLILKWRTLLITTIERGVNTGYYKNTIIPEQVCDFLISGYWGIRNLGKLNNSSACYNGYLNELKKYLDTLK